MSQRRRSKDLGMEDDAKSKIDDELRAYLRSVDEYQVAHAEVVAACKSGLFNIALTRKVRIVRFFEQKGREFQIRDEMGSYVAGCLDEFPCFVIESFFMYKKGEVGTAKVGTEILDGIFC